jgi:hypothetical protein
MIHVIMPGSFVYTVLHHCYKEKINVWWNPILAEIILLIVAQNALQLASWSFIFIYSLIIAQIQPRDIIIIMRSKDGRVITTPFLFFAFFPLESRTDHRAVSIYDSNCAARTVRRICYFPFPLSVRVQLDCINNVKDIEKPKEEKNTFLKIKERIRIILWSNISKIFTMFETLR